MKPGGDASSTATNSADISADQKADDEASSASLPPTAELEKKSITMPATVSTGGSSTPLGIMTPPEQTKVTCLIVKCKVNFNYFHNHFSFQSEKSVTSEHSEHGEPIVPSAETPTSEATTASVAKSSRRKQELTLDLAKKSSPAPVSQIEEREDNIKSEDEPDVAKPLTTVEMPPPAVAATVSTSSTDNVTSTTSESNLIWQRVNMGTGDVRD